MTPGDATPAPRRLRWLAALAATPVVAFVVLLLWFPAINEVETGRTPEYPDVIPRVLPLPPDRVFGATLEAIGDVEHFRLVRAADHARTARVDASGPIGLLDAVLTVEVREHGGQSIVHVRSAGRTGRGDFGQNARNIRALLDAIDARLGTAPPAP